MNMLLVGDVKSLEVVTAAYLSKDDVLTREVLEGVDFHESNRVRFGLPNRTVAKRFKFKLIYGATAWGYANDSDFIDVSTSQDYWQGIINEYYGKYSGMQRWHRELVAQATRDGYWSSPTGRRYDYPSQDVVARMWYWRPKILNYPVQGLGADLVMIARISFARRIRDLPGVLLVGTVHDSIVVDVDESLVSCYNIGKIMKASVADVPANFKRLFGVEFGLPLGCEIKVGKNLKQMESIEC